MKKWKQIFSKEDLRDLRALTEQDWWKILLKLWELHKIELWLSVSDVDFSDKEQVKVLSDRQVYLNAFENVLKIPWNMLKLETFPEYDESDYMPNYDWIQEDEDEI